MRIVPLGLDEANAFVDQHHRHRDPVTGCKFCIGLAVDGQIVGVAIVGRPVARANDNGLVAEVNRLCTDGTRNAPSKLLSAVKKICRMMGYQRLVTYTLPTESGASLRGAGLTEIGLTKLDTWDTPARPRVDTDPAQQKLRWEAVL